MNKYKYQFIGFFSGFILSIIINLTFIVKIYKDPIEIVFLSFLLTFFLTYLGNLIGKLIDNCRK